MSDEFERMTDYLLREVTYYFDQVLWILPPYDTGVYIGRGLPRSRWTEIARYGLIILQAGEFEDSVGGAGPWRQQYILTSVGAMRICRRVLQYNAQHDPDFYAKSVEAKILSPTAGPGVGRYVRAR